jgi:hypothetical protein
MSDTPAGVGAFQSPKHFLKHDETIEIEISNIGTLENKVVFEFGKSVASVPQVGNFWESGTDD